MNRPPSITEHVTHSIYGEGIVVDFHDKENIEVKFASGVQVCVQSELEPLKLAYGYTW